MGTCCAGKATTKTTMGQRLAVALVAVGLGSVVFGLVGFKKHQHDADEIARLAAEQGRSRAALLAPETVHPSERMARWNLLIWAGVGFSYVGVSLGVLAAMHQRMRQRKANAACAATVAHEAAADAA
jgi:amino acid transporter